uniref:T-complex protein 1 subunit eta-like n=1 Tax=Erigeron canadensis TaxID=72917 RepID=UPI001CB9A8D5|nr:T-complex protein 1 subunit eta-like [Erigeron canadensis]
MSDTEDYCLLRDEDVVTPLLRMELRKAAQSLILNGVPPELIAKVFENVSRKVVKQINKYTVSMEDFDMKDVLSKYFATQLPTQLFESSRSHMANIIVDAVYASGYDYEDAGPYEIGMDDFDDGFNLIGIKKVLGGCVENSFSVEGIGIVFKPYVDGFEKLDVVENPEILIINIKPHLNSQKVKDMSELILIDILENFENRHPKVVLTSRAMDEDTKKELAERCIYFADLVPEDDLDRIAVATLAKKIFYNGTYPLRMRIGTCKSFQPKTSGNEVFGIFSGCTRGKAATIVLYGDDQYIEEAEMYVRDLIPEVRSFMKEHTLVDGRKLYYNLIQYIHEEADIADEDLKPIINSFAKAIKVVSESSQNHAIAHGVDTVVWEPPSVKFYAILLAADVVCSQLLDDDDVDYLKEMMGATSS